MSQRQEPVDKTEDWTLAFDCGTSAVKAAVVSSQGELICESIKKINLYLGDGGLAEQDGNEIWDSVVKAAREALKKLGARNGQVKAIVFCAAWKGILPLDRNCSPLGRAAIWMDSRGREQSKRLNQKMGRFIGTGQEYWPRVMRLKEEEPTVWAAAHKIVGLNTYLKYKACGILANEPSDDFVFGVEPVGQKFFGEVLAASGLAEFRQKFVEPLPPQTVVGGLTLEAGKMLGVEPGTPVFNGYGDLPAIMMGTGTGSPGKAHIYIGSSSWFALASELPPEGNPLRVTVSSHLHVGAYVIQSAGLAFDWIVRQLYRQESLQLGSEVFDLVNREVAEVPAGSENLLATHWINGELPPLAKNMRGVFLNLTSLHDRRHMVRAMMESICFAHKASYEAHLAAGGEPIVDVIRVAGGGANSEVWMQMLADVLQLRVEVPAKPQSTGAIGAFYAAQVGRGKIASFSDIGDELAIGRRFEPDKDRGRIYSHLFGVHSQLHVSLKQIFTTLNGDY